VDDAVAGGDVGGGDVEVFEGDRGAFEGGDRAGGDVGGGEGAGGDVVGEDRRELGAEGFDEPGGNGGFVGGVAVVAEGGCGGDECGVGGGGRPRGDTGDGVGGHTLFLGCGRLWACQQRDHRQQQCADQCERHGALCVSHLLYYPYLSC